MAYPLNKHLMYNTWANTKIAEVLHDVDEEIFFRENKSSFSSIGKTVLHIWGAQHVWFKRMEGICLTAFPHMDVNDKLVTLDGLVKSSTDIQELI